MHQDDISKSANNEGWRFGHFILPEPEHLEPTSDGGAVKRLEGGLNFAVSRH